MYIATVERKGKVGDLNTFFAHEAHPYPPSMANGNEMMYHSTKSDIIHCMEREADGIPQDVTEVHAEYDCLIQDGGQLIHVLDPRGAGTFENFTQRLFFKHLQAELRKVPRLDIVWDTYRDMSIK